MEWTSTKEQKPNLYDRVILLYSNGNISGGYYKGKDTFEVDFPDEPGTSVIAWTAAPEY